MNDKVISMADFMKTKEALETGKELDRTDVQLDYNEIMFSAQTLADLAETGEVSMSELVATYEIVANILMQVLDEEQGLQMEMEFEDDQ